MTPAIRTFVTGDTLSFRYQNHRGDTRDRRVSFLAVDYGSNEWYPAKQFFLRCEDLERPGIVRSFAISQIVGDVAIEIPSLKPRQASHYVLCRGTNSMVKVADFFLEQKAGDSNCRTPTP